LKRISIPAFSEIVEEGASKECNELKYYLISENAKLVHIIRKKCFRNCISLDRLAFLSSKSLNQFIGDPTLDNL
jgi:hypothetical protein